MIKFVSKITLIYLINNILMFMFHFVFKYNTNKCISTTYDTTLFTTLCKQQQFALFILFA